MILCASYKPGEQSPAHEKQLANYKSLLAQMGYQNIVPYVLYIKSGELVGVYFFENYINTISY
jgi:hypothetical protein